MTRPILPDETALIEMYENQKQKSCILTSVARQIQDAESVVYCVSKALEYYEGGSESHALLCAGDKLFNLRCDIEALNAYQEKEHKTDTTPATTTPSPANDDDRRQSIVRLDEFLTDAVSLYSTRHAESHDSEIFDLLMDALKTARSLHRPVDLVTDAEVNHG